MPVLCGFAGSFMVGAALSAVFLTNHLGVASVLFQSMFLLAIFLPLYRAECLLGFVLAMVFTFGAVIATLIGCLVVAIAAFLHLLIYPLVIRFFKLARRSN